MKKERRTMKKGNVYEIEEKIGDGDFQPVCKCKTISEAKEMLKALRILDDEERDEKDS